MSLNWRNRPVFCLTDHMIHVAPNNLNIRQSSACNIEVNRVNGALVRGFQIVFTDIINQEDIEIVCERLNRVTIADMFWRNYVPRCYFPFEIYTSKHGLFDSDFMPFILEYGEINDFYRNT